MMVYELKQVNLSIKYQLNLLYIFFVKFEITKMKIKLANQNGEKQIKNKLQIFIVRQLVDQNCVTKILRSRNGLETNFTESIFNQE